MQSIEVVLAMLLAVLASGYLVRLLPFSLPLPLVQTPLAPMCPRKCRRAVPGAVAPMQTASDAMPPASPPSHPTRWRRIVTCWM